jgi:hypothetical protein
MAPAPRNRRLANQEPVIRATAAGQRRPHGAAQYKGRGRLQNLPGDPLESGEAPRLRDHRPDTIHARPANVPERSRFTAPVYKRNKLILKTNNPSEYKFAAWPDPNYTKAMLQAHHDVLIRRNDIL